MNLKCIKRYIRAIVILILFTVISSSQTVYCKEIYFKQIDFSTIGIEGNDNPTINAIFKDSKRFVWLGGEKKLVRFDGIHTLVIPTIDESNIAFDVKAISEFKDKCIVIGTNKGLFRFPNNDDKPELQKIFAKEIDEVTTLLAINSDQVLVGSAHGVKLISLSKASIRDLPISSNLLDKANCIIGMSRLKDVVYILTKDGLYSLNLNKLVYTHVANYSSAGVDQTSIVATPQKLYIGTMGKGIIPYNLKTQHTESPLPIAATVVTSVVTDSGYNNLYIGTDGSGVFEMSIPDEKLLNHLHHQTNNYYSLHNNQVRSLMQDDKNSLWVGYYQNGVDYMLDNTGAFSVFNDDSYISSRGLAVRAMTAKDHKIALGTREGLIYMDFDKHTTTRLNASALRSDMVLSLFETKDKLFIGTYGGGLSMVSLQTMAVEKFSGNGDVTFSNGHVFCITQQDDNNLWIGTNTGLYHLKDNVVVSHYLSSNSKLPEGNVYAIFFDSQHKGWICTEAGICIYDPAHDELRTDVFPKGFPHDKRIHTVYEDSKHRLYFLPEKGTAFRTTLDMKNLTMLNVSKGQELEYKGVVEDKNGAIWLTTNHGVFRSDSKDHWHHYGFADGIPSQVFLQCRPQIDLAGNIWFGNSDGLIKCDPTIIDTCQSKSYGIYPVAVKADGESICIPIIDNHNIKLPEHYATIIFDLSTFNYSIDDAQDYEYSIDGEDWEAVRNDFSVILNDIGGGSHKLIVRHRDDISSEVIINISMPYSWIGKLVIILIISLIAMGIYLIWHLLYTRARARIRRAAEIKAEAERVAKAEELASKKKYSANQLSEEKCREIVSKIQTVMSEQKPFLNPDMNIGDLATLTNVSSHKLSYIFSQYMNMSFYDYVNRYRVDEFKAIVAAYGVDTLTLSALAEKAGFSSRASFFRHFKEIEGITPGEYIKGLSKNH
jgi:ligand-binding sensor domain-containing protein/AraC-like DNA-binding protein